MEKILKLGPDFLDALDDINRNSIVERISGGPKRTKIVFTDHETGKVLGEFTNKIVITGGIKSAIDAFGVESPVNLPNYNTELELDNTLDYTKVKPKNKSIVCLFCVGDSGCGALPKDVFTANYIDRINPVDDIIPFKYVDIDNDINEDMRKVYFGRKTLNDEKKIAYYFKAFDTEPQLHLRYTDGTQINDHMYSIDTTQPAECYVQTKLRITRTDFRDYFEQVKGWDKAKISTLSLCYAWYDDEIDDYKWYQEIYPYSKLNFSTEWLVDLTKGIDIQYSVFY